jgi:hypothetical protein
MGSGKNLKIYLIKKVPKKKKDKFEKKKYDLGKYKFSNKKILEILYLNKKVKMNQ